MNAPAETLKKTLYHLPGTPRGLGWTIIIALVVVGIGAMLTVFMLLEHAEGVRTGYAGIVPGKKARASKLPPVVIVPQPVAPGGANRGKTGN